jgi:hypothetical protein
MADFFAIYAICGEVQSPVQQMTAKRLRLDMNVFLIILPDFLAKSVASYSGGLE